ncbi:MAG TPA: hypothetical protein VKD90_22000 [Gemmataceae bacterium]|nr:hypothetical protein [Gemmataceae bacterium]
MNAVRNDVERKIKAATSEDGFADKSFHANCDQATCLNGVGGTKPVAPPQLPPRPPARPVLARRNSA